MSKKLLLFNRMMTLTFVIGLILAAPAAYAQDRTVTGVVTDSSGEPLPGVTIIEQGTSNSTVSSIDGSFKLNYSGSAPLTFSFIGMVTQNVNVGTRSTIDVTLEDDVTQLEEVVVVDYGYGTMKKSDLTGSVALIGGDDLKKMPVSSVAESLTGRMAGVQVVTTEGSPDATVNIRVRGGSSLTQSGNPLLIVDGFPLDISAFSSLSPADIQSVTVLKDASATAIYGSRGANGVIVVTTKNGSAGRVDVSYNAFFGYKKIAKKLDVLDPSDYAHWQYEYAMMDNDYDTEDITSYTRYFGAYKDIDLYDDVAGNDWQEQVYGRTGTILNHNLSLRGGGEKVNYSLNFAQIDDKAIMVGSDYKRNNATMKMNADLNDKMKVLFSLRYSDQKINGSGANEQNETSSADSRLKHSVTYSPIPISGITTDATDAEIASYVIDPLVATADNDRYQERKNFNMAASFSWELIENLTFKTDFGLDNDLYNDNRFYGLTTYYVKNVPSSENQDLPAVILRDRKRVRYRNVNMLTYDFKNLLGDSHNLNVKVGEEMLNTQSQELETVVHGFPSLFTSEDAFKLTTQGSAQSTDNFLSADDKLLSFFGMANYDYKGKYLLTASFRADGSSKFLGDNAWGYFPAAAVAWKLSEESFMQGTSSWLDNMKVRVSYGVAGNNDIPVNQIRRTFNSSSNTRINGFESYWAPSTTMINPDLKWETTHTRNIGLDFGLLKGRVNGTLDLYYNTTQDLLMLFPLPDSYEDQYRNLGEIDNKGIEASLSIIAIDKEKYGLSFNFNISHNQNEIVSLGGLEELGFSSGWASTDIPNDYFLNEGGSIGEMYGYVSDGRYEVSDFEGYDESTGQWTLADGVADVSEVVGDPAPGMMKLKDISGTEGDEPDGIVDINDRKKIGNATPLHTGGFVLNGYAYGFDLSAAFNWSYGNDIYNANKVEYTTATPRYKYRNLIDMQEAGERWTNIDPATGLQVTDPTALAAMNENTTMWSPYMDRYVFSDWAVEDGSFLRLNTLTLGYTVPSELTERIRVQNLRFYVSAFNVFVWTNYSGFDPEVSTRRRTPVTPGVDYSAYPKSRQLVFGLNLNF